MPWIRIVIVNYNAGVMLQEAVDALAQQTFTDFDVRIVDNGSEDGSIEDCQLPDGRFQIIQAGQNLGFAAGANLGANGSGTDWLAMLNPDAIPEKDWLRQLFAASQQYPSDVAFGSLQLSMDDPDVLDGAGDNTSIYGLSWRGGYRQAIGMRRLTGRITSPCAAAAAYRTDCFREMGGFCERFFCYVEDVDLGLRLNMAGYTIRQLDRARIRHHGSAISGPNSAFTRFYGTRNSISLQLRCFPAFLLPFSLPVFIMLQMGLGIVSGSVRARLRGVLAGLASFSRSLRERKDIYRHGKLSGLQVARLLVWNPFTVIRRYPHYHDGGKG